MTVFIALLRGINVGGHKTTAMAELKALVESLGFSEVHTLLQSGNVVLRSHDADASAAASRIEAGIQARFGFESRVILRTADQMRAVAQQHPFSAAQLAEANKILVAFLQAAPAADAVQTLRDTHTGPEIIYPGRQDVYIFYPEGMGRSKLDNGFIERRLKTLSTGRNWNTVGKLTALAESLGG